MRHYDFTIILKNAPELTEELADALFAAGCEDGTPSRSRGVFLIEFHREAESLETAIGSAIRDVKAAGQDVDRVEIEAASMRVPA